GVQTCALPITPLGRSSPRTGGTHRAISSAGSREQPTPSAKQLPTPSAKRETLGQRAPSAKRETYARRERNDAGSAADQSRAQDSGGCESSSPGSSHS